MIPVVFYGNYGVMGYIKTQLILAWIYYVEDMFRPLWAILKSQTYKRKIIQCTSIGFSACFGIATRFFYFYGSVHYNIH